MAPDVRYWVFPRVLPHVADGIEHAMTHRASACTEDGAAKVMRRWAGLGRRAEVQRVPVAAQTYRGWDCRFTKRVYRIGPVLFTVIEAVRLARPKSKE